MQLQSDKGCSNKYMKVNLALKAALLSGLVYPGAGHFLLKKYVMCVVLVCSFSLPLMLILSDMMSVVQTLVEQIQTGVVPLDVIEIRQQLLSNIKTKIGETSNYTLSLLVILWGIGIVDSYRIGIITIKQP